MLTYKQVLNEFEAYLAEDDMCQVQSSDDGYIVMLIEDVAAGPFESILCQTPEKLREVLLEYQQNLTAYEISIKDTPF
ncbi:hypothetical protein RFF05_08140 [Bengtsoniella intestinalis]|uniref:hypothetical protein n=1 Tax=Bengtsoniella intestinalis TaxID=3073143 RepID=UPI00391EFC99